MPWAVHTKQKMILTASSELGVGGKNRKILLHATTSYPVVGQQEKAENCRRDKEGRIVERTEVARMLHSLYRHRWIPLNIREYPEYLRRTTMYKMQTYLLLHMKSVAVYYTRVV